MSKVKPIAVRTADQLARALDLDPSDAIEWTIRAKLNDKIIEAAQKSGLTHTQLAKAANTSRSRLTALLNRDRSHVSTDLMLRILAALGYQPKIAFQKTRPAA